MTVNEAGAWLGEVETPPLEGGALETKVVPLADEDGDYIPAPTDWRSRIIETLDSE